MIDVNLEGMYPLARYMTGEIVNVNGGSVLCG